MVESSSDHYLHAPIRYAHTKEVDTFHDSIEGKVRVTRDGRGEVRGVVSKSRVADMNVYSPKRVFDWRLSINTEVPGTFPFPFLFSFLLPLTNVILLYKFHYLRLQRRTRDTKIVSPTLTKTFKSISLKFRRRLLLPQLMNWK